MYSCRTRTRCPRGLVSVRLAVRQLTQVQRDQFTSFINKATGWFTVALGAALLAAEQTWQVVEHYRWPSWLFWLLMIVMLGISVLNTAQRMSHDDRAARSIAQRAVKPRHHEAF
jgi:hypothetical protein